MTVTIDAATSFPFPDTADQHEFDAVCQALREQGPVVRVEMPDGLIAWVITRYADGKRAMMDQRLVKDLRRMSDPAHGLGGNRYAEDAFVVEGRHMLNSDGVEHSRLRAVVGAELSAAAINRRRPEIEQVCRDLVGEFRDAGTVDLMEVFARPVPEIVMARVLGTPDETLRAAAVLSRKLGGRDDPASVDMRKSYHDLLDIITDCSRNADNAPEGSVLAALHRARAEKIINKRELISTVTMLLGAGISSTAIGIGFGAMTAMHTAATLRHLLHDEDDAKAAVEELLRFHPPFPFSPWRFALEPVQVQDVTIPAGAVVFVLLAAVNHDGALAADAGELRPRRERTGHLTFGYGPHFCVGAHLARAEIEIALRVLFDELPDLRPVQPEDEIRWHGLLFDRTPSSVPVYPSGSAR
ncbi:cytochrome P450 [Nocardia alni]|uniref:cytochrome P450 n=1 Tax=Nocardia alni TaxID=2815723 RepID=UPI001C232690|nr:cytochrome P450 [Nocardia alni]